MFLTGKTCDSGLISGAAGLYAVISPPFGNTEFQIGLYANNVAIVDTTVFADLVECTFGGYSRSGFLFKRDPSLPIAMDTPGGSSVLQFDGHTFQNTSGSPTTVYGWFFGLKVLSGGVGLVAGQLFSSPIVLPSLGTITLIPPEVLTSSRY